MSYSCLRLLFKQQNVIIKALILNFIQGSLEQNSFWKIECFRNCLNLYCDWSTRQIFDYINSCKAKSKNYNKNIFL